MSAQARRFSLQELAGPADRRGYLRRTPRVTFESLKLVWRASRGQMIATTILQAVAAAATGVQLLVIRRLLQQLVAVSGGSMTVGEMVPTFALIVGVTGVLGATTAVTRFQQQLLFELVARYTLDGIIAVASKVSYQSFEDPEFHDQLERARTLGMYRPIEMVSAVTALMTAVLTSIGIAAAVFALAPILLPLVALAAIPLLLATIHNSGQSYTFEYLMTPQNRERAYVTELLTSRDSAKEIRIFGSTGFLRERYRRLADERVARLRVFLRGRLKVSLIGTIATALGGAIALGALVLLLSDGRIGVPTAVAAAAAMQLLSSRLATMTTSIGRLIESGMFLDDYRTFVRLGAAAAEPEPPAGGATPARAAFEGLTVENVRFTYPGCAEPALEDVSLRVDPGEVVALVGENGSGKTTLVKLVCQLYRPQAGRILWSGMDAGDQPAEAVRDQMTVIFQDFVQYHLSARDNIALGRVERPHALEDIAAAARHGGADSFLSQLPEGYDTRLGRQFYGGQELSVGQWQRLALSRAFYRGGEFLVLDEPTAALDPRAEQELFSQMRELAEGRSVLLISHRFSSVRMADRIYVMRQGRIAESGSHEELMALGGQYAELFELQAAAYLYGDGSSPSVTVG